MTNVTKYTEHRLLSQSGHDPPPSQSSPITTNLFQEMNTGFNIVSMFMRESDARRRLGSTNYNRSLPNFFVSFLLKFEILYFIFTEYARDLERKTQFQHRLSGLCKSTDIKNFAIYYHIIQVPGKLCRPYCLGNPNNYFLYFLSLTYVVHFFCIAVIFHDTSGEGSMDKISLLAAIVPLLVISKWAITGWNRFCVRLVSVSIFEEISFFWFLLEI